MFWFNQTLGRDYSSYKVGQVVSTCKIESCFHKNRQWYMQHPEKVPGIINVFHVITTVERSSSGVTELSLATKVFDIPFWDQGYVSDEKLKDWQLATVDINMPNISKNLRNKLYKEVSDKIGQKFNCPLMEKME